jgi:hypothetical protein
VQAPTVTLQAEAKAIAATALAFSGLLATVLAGCASHPPSAGASRGYAAAGPAPEAEPSAMTSPGEIASVPVERHPWRFAGHEGVIIVTPHYRLHTTLSRRSVLERLPLFMERALRNYTTALGSLPPPPTRLETYLFETRNQWEAKTRQMLPDEAATFLTLGRGGFTTRGTSVLYYIGRSDTLAIAAHEGWHQYSQRTLKDQLPLWLEEGIAAYMEGYRTHPGRGVSFRPWANLERYHTLRRAVRADRLIPLSHLLQRTPQSFLEDGKSRLLVYYAQVWALLHYLAEGEEGRYREALQRVLIDAAQGRLAGQGRGRSGKRRLGPEVLTAYFESDLETFERRYLRFVGRIVRTGGRDRIVQGRSPLED